MRPKSFAQLAEDAIYKSRRRRFALRSWECATVAKRLEGLLDFVVEREASALRLREDHASVDDNVELTRFARFDYGVFAESINE